ncbi:MAG TPA: GNAT family N-acetyltransferase [Candidatus Limnocylindrales bacterium]|nr:GNAT family N-acetyltransferase [Candidatus Limnocylindrales bacterium]
MGSNPATDAEWDALCDRTAARPWVRPGWLRAWHDAFGRGPLRVITVRDEEGRVRAVAPVEVLPGEHRSPTNYHSPAFELLTEDRHAARDLASALFAGAPRRLSLAFVPATSPTRDLLARHARRGGRDVFERVLERCPFVEPDGDWGRYLQARRGHLVRELRRRRRGLERTGAVELEVVGERAHEPDELASRLDEFLRVEASGWKGERGTAIAATPATLGFYRTLATWLHARGALRLALLRHDGRAIAADFAVEAGGVHALLKTGYEPSYRSSSPGMLLREAMLKRAFERGLHRYDFLGHADPWKREWTELAEPQLLVQAFAPSLAGTLDAAAQRYGRPVARGIIQRLARR